MRRLLQRQILPLEPGHDVLRLYVDPEDAASRRRQVRDRRQPRGQGAQHRRDPAVDVDRRRPSTPSRSSRAPRCACPGERLSFGTYFNAFPASYWRRWTVVTEVTPDREVSRRGRHPDRLPVDGQRPFPAGRLGHHRRGGKRHRSSSTSPLKPFVDGGWYWYDVVAGDDDVVVESAEWTAEVPEDRAEHGTVDIGITTMNRPDFCAKLLGQIGATTTCCGPTSTRSSWSSRAPSKVVDSEHFPAAAGLAGRHAAGHRAGQPRRLRRLRPRPAGVGAQGHRDVLHDAWTTTWSASPRASSARSPSATSRAARPSSAGTCSASTRSRGCTASARSCSRGGSGGCRRPAASSTGTSPPATCARPAGCTSASTSTSTAGSCA